MEETQTNGLTDNEKRVLQVARDCGANYAAVGRMLGVNRHVARELVLNANLQVKRAESHAEIDPKGKLSRRLSNTLLRENLHAVDAVRTEAWKTVRGMGVTAKKELLKHYGS